MKAFCPFQAPNGIGTIVCKTHRHVRVSYQIPQLLKGELISGMSIAITFFFDLNYI
jgi:hypothetical protein